MPSSASHPDRKTTTTITFRLNTNVVNILRGESENRNISLNTIINQILLRYVDWDMYENKVGMIFT